MYLKAFSSSLPLLIFAVAADFPTIFIFTLAVITVSYCD